MQKSLDIFNRIVTDLLNDEQKTPVTDYIPFEKLKDSLDLSLNEAPLNDDEFEKILRDLVLSTPRTTTNAFFNQLYGGRTGKAVLGDLLAVVMNNSMYTYKVAGAQVGVEKEILKEVCKMLGWGENSNGTFASGGSLTNFMSMLMARDAFDANIKEEGAKAKMTVYTSIESHYSIPKNASFSGIGRDNVRFIPTDEFGKMDVHELEKVVEKDIIEGYHPVLVNATAGTTVLGAFDPVKSISEICKKHNIWLHVDGAYCGSVLFSSKYKHLIEGVEDADSFSFNAHKMMGTPLTCSIIVVKDKKYLNDSFATKAEYLYQTDHDEFNLGKTSLQCGRRNDALKFWTLWKSIGTSGLENFVDHQFALADSARDYIRANSDYTLYSFDDSISICFNYKGISAKEICSLLYEHAELLVSYGAFREDDFIRLVTINGTNKKEDVLNFFKTLEKFVAENSHLFKELSVPVNF